MDHPKPYLLLYNPSAGKGRTLRFLNRVKHYLIEEGIAYETMETPASREVTAPNFNSFRAILLLGGDGTLHRVMNYWGVPSIPLGLISTGSGNDFARESSGIRQPEEQLKNILKGKIHPTDLGRCNGIYFATGVGIGFDGLIAHKLQRKGWLTGHAAYYAAVVREMLFYREKEIEVLADGASGKRYSFMLTIGNTRDFGGGFRVTPGAIPNDGWFQLCLVHRVNLLQRALNLQKVKKGRHLNLPFVDALEVKDVHIQADEELHCHMDGECYKWKEFRVEILPSAINLLF